MEDKPAFIDFKCSCGAHYQFANEQLARRARCPKCGAKAVEILGLEPVTPPEPPKTSVAPPVIPAPRPSIRPSAPPPIPVKPRMTPPPGPSAVPPPVEGEKPKLRLRGGGEPHVTQRPIVLPGLEPDAPQPSAPVLPPAEESIPVLKPIEESEAPITLKPAATPRPVVAPKPPQAKAKITIGKQHGTEAKHPTPQTPKATVPCPAHPEKQATHNCMNCGKPICIECVHQHGYYCSTACKEVVRSREPKLVKTDEAEVVDAKVGQTMEKLGSFVAKLKVPVYVLILLVVGYFVYMKFWGPRGRVTANFTVNSEMEVFDVKLTDPDVVVFQRNDDLCSAKLSTQEEIWKTAMRPLEEKYEPPKRTNHVADSRSVSENLGGYSEGGTREYRDRLKLTAVQGDHAVVRSARQLIVFGAKDGAVKWKIFNPETSLTVLAVHEGGILCQLSPRWDAARSGAKPRTVNLSFDDGSEKWSLPDSFTYGTRILTWNGKLVWLVPETSNLTAAARKKKKTTEDDGDDDTDPSSAAVPKGKQTVKLLSPTDGTVIAQKDFDLAGRPELDKVGHRLCLTAGNQLMMFETGLDPTISITLPDQPITLTAMQDDDEDDDGLSFERTRILLGGDAMAMKTAAGVVVLDAKSGQQKWVRSDIEAEALAVGPDGAVYATVEIPKEESNRGVAEKYRVAVVADGGFSHPKEAVTTLLKLDAKTGKTLWGVKNIGRRVLFVDKEVYVVDTFSKMHLFSGSDMFAGHLSVRSISPKNGKDNWKYLVKAQLYRMQMIDRKLFMVVAEEEPAGRTNPICNYQLRVIEKK